MKLSQTKLVVAGPTSYCALGMREEPWPTTSSLERNSWLIWIASSSTRLKNSIRSRRDERVDSAQCLGFLAIHNNDESCQLSGDDALYGMQSADSRLLSKEDEEILDWRFGSRRFRYVLKSSSSGCCDAAVVWRLRKLFDMISFKVEPWRSLESFGVMVENMTVEMDCEQVQLEEKVESELAPNQTFVGRGNCVEIVSSHPGVPVQTQSSSRWTT